MQLDVSSSRDTGSPQCMCNCVRCTAAVSFWHTLSSLSEAEKCHKIVAFVRLSLLYLLCKQCGRCFSWQRIVLCSPLLSDTFMSPTKQLPVSTGHSSRCSSSLRSLWWSDGSLITCIHLRWLKSHDMFTWTAKQPKPSRHLNQCPLQYLSQK